MEFLADGPAVLGGIMMSVALGAWTLGRWQGGLAVPDDQSASLRREPAGDRMQSAPIQPAQLASASLHSGGAPVQDGAGAERRSALGMGDTLGELHAEISAYRRAQQVLTGPEGDGLHLRPLHVDARSECRYLGFMGEPTCGLPEPSRRACACGIRCARADPLSRPAMPERLCQPAPPALGLTRV